jgi:peroxiredoxin/uncharacterized membrane protein YphA (DoxX/SURF4 family)
MDLLLLAARLVLAGVFIVAGLAKLADPEGSRSALLGFRVPAVLVPLAALLLPLAELAIGVMLIPLATAWWAAIGAAALLGLFVVGITTSLIRGEAPDCHCFGQLHSAPAGRSTLIRNGLLAGIAGVIIVWGQTSPGASAVAWIGDLSRADGITLLGGLALLFVVALQSWLIYHLMRQSARFMERLDMLEAILRPGDDLDPAPASVLTSATNPRIGTLAPAFSLPDLNGETTTLDTLRSLGKPVLLIFSNPGCGPCRTLFPDIVRWRKEYASKLTMSIITRGSLEANRAKAEEYGPVPTLLQDGYEVSNAYDAAATPSAVIVNSDGTFGSAVARGPGAIRALVNRAVTDLPAILPLHEVPAREPARQRSARNGSNAASATVNIGDPAPVFARRDLDGNEVDLASFRGSPTAVLFWNPGCGFCSRMLNDLKEWEANRSSDDPQLFVVSTGTPEANRKMGLKSIVVLDQGFILGHEFGVGGTPSGILIDAEGRVASQVRVGAPGVMALLSRSASPAVRT